MPVSFGRGRRRGETDCKHPLIALPGNKQKHQLAGGRAQKGELLGTIVSPQLCCWQLCECASNSLSRCFTRCVKEEGRKSLGLCACRVTRWRKASASGWSTSSNVPKHSSSTAWWGGAQVSPANTHTCTSWLFRVMDLLFFCFLLLFASVSYCYCLHLFVCLYYSRNISDCTSGKEKWVNNIIRHIFFFTTFKHQKMFLFSFMVNLAGVFDLTSV